MEVHLLMGVSSLFPFAPIINIRINTY